MLKNWKLSTKIIKKTKDAHSHYFYSEPVLGLLVTAIRQEKVIKKHSSQKRSKMSLFPDDMTLFIEIPKDSINKNICFCYSVTKSCPPFYDPINCSMIGSLVLHYLPEFAQIHVHWVVMLSNHLILCHPLLLLSIFPSIRVFFNESALHIRWPKCWSFNFNINPSNKYSGLISFRIDWLDLFAVQGTLKSLLQYHN